MGNVSRSNLIELMSKMRSMVDEESTPPVCSDIDWSVPHHYGIEEFEILNVFTKKLAGFIQRALQFYCDENFEAKLNTYTERFACFLVNEINQNQKNHYFLPLVVQGKGHVGFLGFPFESCTKLIAQMFRDPDAEIGLEGEISSLEESILQDITTSLADAVIEGFAEYNITNLQKTEQLIRGEWPVIFRDLEDMIHIDFEAKCPRANLNISLYMLEDVLAPLVKANVIDTSAEMKKKTPDKIISQMREAPMEVSARLCSAMITLHDVMRVQKGDVIVLDRKVDTPVDVLVNGQMCFKAWPAQHSGRSAIVVADSNTNR